MAEFRPQFGVQLTRRGRVGESHARHHSLTCGVAIVNLVLRSQHVPCGQLDTNGCSRWYWHYTQRARAVQRCSLVTRLASDRRASRHCAIATSRRNRKEKTKQLEPPNRLCYSQCFSIGTHLYSIRDSVYAVYAGILKYISEWDALTVTSRRHESEWRGSIVWQWAVLS